MAGYSFLSPEVITQFSAEAERDQLPDEGE